MPYEVNKNRKKKKRVHARELVSFWRENEIALSSNYEFL